MPISANVRNQNARQRKLDSGKVRFNELWMDEVIYSKFMEFVEKFYKAHADTIKDTRNDKCVHAINELVDNYTLYLEIINKQENCESQGQIDLTSMSDDEAKLLGELSIQGLIQSHHNDKEIAKALIKLGWMPAKIVDELVKYRNLSITKEQRNTIRKRLGDWKRNTKSNS